MHLRPKSKAKAKPRRDKDQVEYATTCLQPTESGEQVFDFWDECAEELDSKNELEHVHEMLENDSVSSAFTGPLHCIVLYCIHCIVCVDP